MRLQGRVASITGAGSGMGRVAARRFAAEGAQVLVSDLDVTAGEETVAQIEAEGGEAIFVRTDVTKEDDVVALVAAGEDRFGKIDVLYNNAGIFLGSDGSVEETDPAAWAKTLAVNLTGVYLCCRHGIPALRRAGGGAIVNVASFVAWMGAATPQVAYTASKGGVLALTREIAVTHAREGIRANALCPGPVETPLLEELLADPWERHRRLVHVPMGRLASAEEIVNAALFLASDEAAYVTGTSLLVDGGITAAYTTPLDT